MHRFFAPTAKISEKNILIRQPQQVHHIKDVLRFNIGDEVMVCDNKNSEYLCRIQSMTNKQIGFEVLSCQARAKQGTAITIACAIPKQSKMDDIVDKLTQLGVKRIIPMLTERVVVKLDKKKAEARLARWKKIAQSAAQQSQRSAVAIIDPVEAFKDILSGAGNFELKLIPALTSERKPLREVVSKKMPRSILLLIGPEGDFTPQEVRCAKEKGFVAVTLGENVLRVDTAAVAVVSFLKLYENL